MLLMETDSPLGPLRPWADHHDLLVRWYDHWLKGIDTGYMDEPPIRLLVKGKNVYRDEREWPLARTQWTKFYLGPQGSLAPVQPASDSSASFQNDPDIPLTRAAPCLTYVTAPFERETEVTGPVVLHLHASLDREDATWVVVLRDIAPDGASRVLTRGWLRASHRETDPHKSRPWKPWHPHARRLRVPPREICEYAIEVRETSNAFLPGHRLALDVKGQDTLADDPIWVHECNPLRTVHTIHCGPRHPSHLLLPVIPG